jgi:hypothetical protein
MSMHQVESVGIKRKSQIAHGVPAIDGGGWSN